MVNIEPLIKSPVHRWCSSVLKPVEHNSPVVKRDTPYSPVHMNAALCMSEARTQAAMAATPRQLTPTRTLVEFIDLMSHTWYLSFYVLATSKVISGRVSICDSDGAHLWQLYSGASLGNQGASTMTWLFIRHFILTLSQPLLSLS